MVLGKRRLLSIGNGAEIRSLEKSRKYPWLKIIKSMLCLHVPSYEVLYDFSLTVKAVPHERVIRTGQPKT